MTAYRLWPSTSGPGTPVAYSGNFISGTMFCATGEVWFQGYWWWVCASGGQATTATKCALWQLPPGNGSPVLVPGSVTTSGTLSAGWNYIPLATPLPLSPGGSSGMTPPVTGAGIACYLAAVACNGPFPDTNGYWGTGGPGVNGITSGPLTAYSAGSGEGGTMPFPYIGAQGGYSVGGSDPSTTAPTSASGIDNFWVDVQVSDYSGAPSGTSLRLWPGFPVVAPNANNDTTVAVSGTAFSLSQACSLDRIWMFSPPNISNGLATRVGIWNTGTKAEVSGTDNSSPSWKVPGGGAASAGSGWIYVDYTGSGVTLPAGNYCAAFFNGNGGKIYYDSANYFYAGTDPKGGGPVGGAGWNGISWGAGILSAPNVGGGPQLAYDDSSGTFPGQGQYQPGNTAWQYPSEFEASTDWGETRWADVEVTPAAGASGAAALAGSGALAGAGLVTVPAASVLAGSGALGAVAIVTQPGAAALSGSGAVTAGAAVQFGEGASLAGAGALAAAAAVALPASAPLAGSGSVTAAVSVSALAGASLAGTGSFAAGVILALAAAASLAGSGALSVTVQVLQPATGPSAAWSVTPSAPRWTCTPRGSALPVFPPIAALSLECVNVTWQSALDGTSVDPTGQTENQPELPVQFAFPQTSGNYAQPAQPVTWFTGSWLLGGTGRGYVSQALVGPGGVVTLTAGLSYDCWSKISGSPESPVKFAGVLAVF